METKICTKCGEEYPATREYFYSAKHVKDGLSSLCKRCCIICTTNWQKRHSKKVTESQRNYVKTLRGYITHLVNDIKQRCTNPKAHNYKSYGGRGIKCLFTAKELYAWVISESVEPRGKNIHRIDNDGNYILNNITFMDGGLHTSLHNTLRRQELSTC